MLRADHAARIAECLGVFGQPVLPGPREAVAHDDARRIALNRGGSVHVGSQLLALARNPHILDHGGNIRAEIVTHQGPIRTLRSESAFARLQLVRHPLRTIGKAAAPVRNRRRFIAPPRCWADASPPSAGPGAARAPRGDRRSERQSHLAASDRHVCLCPGRCQGARADSGESQALPELLGR